LNIIANNHADTYSQVLQGHSTKQADTRLRAFWTAYFEVEVRARR